jgi:hypothetical protein
MKQYLKAHRIGIIRATLATIALSLIFGLYLVTIGIPRTAARNLFNKGEVALELGKKSEAKSYFEQAYAKWPESYIKEALNNLN